MLDSKRIFPFLPLELMTVCFLYLSPKELAQSFWVNKLWLTEVLKVLFLSDSKQAIIQQERLLQRESIQYHLSLTIDSIIKIKMRDALTSCFSTYSHKLTILGFFHKIQNSNQPFIETRILDVLIFGIKSRFNYINVKFFQKSVSHLARRLFIVERCTPSVIFRWRTIDLLDLLAPSLSKMQAENIIIESRLQRELRGVSPGEAVAILSILAPKFLHSHNTHLANEIFNLLKNAPKVYTTDYYWMTNDYIRWQPLLALAMKAPHEKKNTSQKLLLSMMNRQLAIIATSQLESEACKREAHLLIECTKFLSPKLAMLIANQMLIYILKKPVLPEFTSLLNFLSINKQTYLAGTAPANRFSFYEQIEPSFYMSHILDFFTALATRCAKTYPVIMTDDQLLELLESLLAINLEASEDKGERRVTSLFIALSSILSKEQVTVIRSWATRNRARREAINQVYLMTTCVLAGIASRLSPAQAWSVLIRSENGGDFLIYCLQGQTISLFVTRLTIPQLSSLMLSFWSTEHSSLSFATSVEKFEKFMNMFTSETCPIFWLEKIMVEKIFPKLGEAHSPEDKAIAFSAVIRFADRFKLSSFLMERVTVMIKPDLPSFYESEIVQHDEIKMPTSILLSATHWSNNEEKEIILKILFYRLNSDNMRTVFEAMQSCHTWASTVQDAMLIEKTVLYLMNAPLRCWHWYSDRMLISLFLKILSALIIIGIKLKIDFKIDIQNMITEGLKPMLSKISVIAAFFHPDKSVADVGINVSEASLTRATP